ncbi:sulfatase family protein [Limnoglobus roseus]|uniref:Arylsulfatase n=1 Tax=Limnoglobus roseus TaxID=2598579 RepID=A0A5C1A4Z5_9BACT|nr:sulfatase [Limnoglobus roseus]QEL14181.1 arylsulfatase [Limnoglobus roseus]
MRSLVALAVAIAFGLTPAGAAEAKPNVVVIFIDDLGYADIGPFGATKQKTPNLDRMAAEGMKLTSFYAAPVCSVSRAQLMTGCYGVRVSVPGVYSPGGPQGLNPKEITIAERLKELGYATQCVGKWHLGDQPAFLPTKQGFDHYLGIPYSNDMQRKSKVVGERVVPLVRDDAVAELLTDEKQSGIVERYTAEAVGFIRANRDRPFFLYLPHSAVHTPIHPGEKFRGKSANGRFGDWVEEMDWSVGQVLDTLRELKLAEKTLVVFTSDNGPWLVKGADGGSAKPLRGGKGSTWEGGVRVPTIAWWPGKIAPKTVSDVVAGTIDLLPTCVTVAGSMVPADPIIDGRDLSPVLFGTGTQSPREAHYYFNGYNLQAVRQGPWKLAIAPQTDAADKTTVEASKTNPRLYNLDTDIGETTNVADRHPEIVEKLKSLAMKMNDEIGGNAPKARRPAGVVTNPTPLYPIDETPAPKVAVKPAALDKLKPGDTIPSAAAPQVGGTAFTLACQFETELRDTVIVAHGGAAAGYALHLKDGRVAFAVRTGAKDAVTDVQSGPIKGLVKVTATFGKDGTMTLSVGDQAAVTGKAPALIPRQPQEDFCLGHDNGQPVANYAKGKKPFEGKITDLKVTTP